MAIALFIGRSWKGSVSSPVPSTHSLANSRRIWITESVIQGLCAASACSWRSATFVWAIKISRTLASLALVQWYKLRESAALQSGCAQKEPWLFLPFDHVRGALQKSNRSQRLNLTSSSYWFLLRWPHSLIRPLNKHSLCNRTSNWERISTISKKIFFIKRENAIKNVAIHSLFWLVSIRRMSREAFGLLRNEEYHPKIARYWFVIIAKRSPGGCRTLRGIIEIYFDWLTLVASHWSSHISWPN